MRSELHPVFRTFPLSRSLETVYPIRRCMTPVVVLMQDLTQTHKKITRIAKLICLDMNKINFLFLNGVKEKENREEVLGRRPEIIASDCRRSRKMSCGFWSPLGTFLHQAPVAGDSQGRSTTRPSIPGCRCRPGSRALSAAKGAGGLEQEHKSGRKNSKILETRNGSFPWRWRKTTQRRHRKNSPKKATL